MPKNRKVVKDGSSIKKLKVPSKFLIGSRSGGISASLMSTTALMSALGDKDKSKYWNKVKAVLTQRGVSYV